MAHLFDTNRNYVPGDPDLDVIGSREKPAQRRHRGTGPAFYKLGRKIVCRGENLNVWAEARRVERGKSA